MSIETQQQRRPQHEVHDDGAGSRPRTASRRAASASSYRDWCRAINLGEAIEVLLRRRERGMASEYYLG